MPLVSILLSVHDGADTVGTAIESILEQTFEDWELIAVDDGSTDSTKEVLARYADDHRVVPISIPHGGLAHALNVGRSRASGPLLARMDADDRCLPLRLEKQVDFLRAHPRVGVLGAAAIAKRADGSSFTMIRPADHEDLVARIRYENPFIHPTVVIRRDLLESVGGYDETLRRSQDRDLWLRLHRVTQFANLESPLLHYNFRPTITLQSIVYGAYVLARHGVREHNRLPWSYAASRFLAVNSVRAIRGYMR